MSLEHTLGHSGLAIGPRIRDVQARRISQVHYDTFILKYADALYIWILVYPLILLYYTQHRSPIAYWRVQTLCVLYIFGELSAKTISSKCPPLYCRRAIHRIGVTQKGLLGSERIRVRISTVTVTPLPVFVLKTSQCCWHWAKIRFGANMPTQIHAS